MCKVFREYNVLHPEEIGLSHQCSHVFVDKVDVVFWFKKAIHVYIHDDIKSVVNILSHEGEYQLKDLSRDVILHLADINPFKGGFEIHCLRFWEDQSSAENTDSEGFEVHFVEELHDDLQDGAYPG